MADKFYKCKINVPIYNTNAMLCVVKDMEDMQIYLDKKVKGTIDVIGADGCVFDIYTTKGLEYYIVLVEDRLSHNLIAHEIYHLGVKITTDVNIVDEESTAWLIGFLTENIYKVLEKKEFKI
jgi:hypothetical protein